MEMNVPSGYLGIVTRSYIDRTTLPTIKTVDVATLLKDYMSKQQSATAAVEAKLKALQNATRGDADVQKANMEYRQAQAEQEESAKKVEEAQEIEKQQDEPDKRQEGFGNQESREVERVFGDEKGSGPVE
jgi:hypothetical protein